ncbi:MAG: DUF3623 domain-containing protein [Anaerolineales bacterium]|nr:DUF3623 domain-containing protein [Anaerolineales bacterium]MCB9127096.1 DUF3623 domain-containing protein [Ardenticatenales bacterium]
MNGIWGVLLPPFLVALVVWWFSTGLIIALYRRSRRTQRWAALLATLSLVPLLAGLFALGQSSSRLAVYLSFAGGTVIWGLLLGSYYLGFVTGLGGHERTAPPTDGRLGRRFWLALRASLFHELLVVGALLLLWLILRDQPNRWAFWTMLTLWLMHSSGKLNVFFGVRNFRIEFLPAHLHFLDRFLEKKPINPFFPLSVFIASAIALALAFRAFAPGVSASDATGLLLLSWMMALGLLEHWLLVLPIPKTIWGWGIRALPARHQGENAVHHQGAALPEPITD